jgi:hypothetical protein
MAQILDPLPPDYQNGIVCCYVNATSKIQVVRISNIPNWHFERVVFPGQRLVFESMPQGLLEVHTGMMASAILSDKIHCSNLRIDMDLDLSDDENSEMVEDSTTKSSEKELIKLQS